MTKKLFFTKFHSIFSPYSERNPRKTTFDIFGLLWNLVTSCRLSRQVRGHNKCLRKPPVFSPNTLQTFLTVNMTYYLINFIKTLSGEISHPQYRSRSPDNTPVSGSMCQNARPARNPQPPAYHVTSGSASPHYIRNPVNQKNHWSWTRT